MNVYGVPLQALNITPATFSLTAGAGANASVAGVVNVTNGNVADLYTYIAEVQVDSTYEVGYRSVLCMAQLLADLLISYVAALCTHITGSASMW